MVGVPEDPRPNRATTGPVMREANASDLGRIVELLTLGAVPGAASGAEDPADPGGYASALAEIDATDGAVLVAELDGEVVGVCQLIVFRHLQRRGGRCAEIESVHVHPERRGSGIGSALLLYAIERARGLGCYRLQLTSNVVRSDAHRFYERLGFTPSHLGFKLPLR